MKIAILSDALDLQYAGIHVYLRGLLNALTHTDRKNEYILVRPKAGGEFENVNEIVVPVLPLLPGHRRIREFTSIPRRLIREGVDVVLEPAHFGPFCLPKGIKRITIIHDLTPVRFPEFHPALSSQVQKMTLPHILRKADCILANSGYTKRDIEKCYPSCIGKTHVVFPGKESIFQPARDAAVLEKYKIRQPFLLSVGTIEPRKNLLTLLKSYESFRRQSEQPLQWVLVGKKGWKNESFFQALEVSPFRGDIILTGYTERLELPVLYSMARIFIYPSLYEGFGLPVLEAMSCGAPVLISNSSSLPEVGGDAACYFDPTSEEELTKQLIELCFDESKLLKMSELSLIQASKFNWEESAERLINIFQTWSDGSESRT